MIRNYLKISIRNLWRSRTYSTLIITGLGISLACCLLIACFVWDELSHDHYSPYSSDIYRVTERQLQQGIWYNVAVTPGPLAPALQHDFAEIVNTARMGAWYGLFTNGKTIMEEKNLFFADASLLPIFGFEAVKGNPKTMLKRINEFVITAKVAEKYFGKDWSRQPDLVGKVFKFSNQTDFQLVGILKNPPEKSHIQFDILMSFENVKASQWDYQWGSNNFHTYLQLKAGTDGKNFEKKVALQLKKYKKPTDDLLVLQPLGDIYLQSKFDFNTDWGKRSDILFVQIFLVVGIITLLIAIVNYINLATARANQRIAEMGIRKAVGASPQHLVLQVLTEAFICCALAMLVALVLTNFGLPTFNDICGKHLVFNQIIKQFWPFLPLVVGMLTLLVGLYPAVVLSSSAPVNIMKGFGVLSAKKTFRNYLVIGQFSISILLTISTLVIYQQLRFIQQKDLGFNKSQLLYVRLAGNLIPKATLFKHDVAHQSFVTAASLTTSNFVDIGNESNIEWEGQVPNDNVLITQVNAEPDLIPTLGMQLVQGRNFSTRFSTDSLGAFVINESAARRMGFDNQAVGKKIKFWGAEGKVIGVVKDFHFRRLNVAIAPFIMRYQPSTPYFTLLVKVKPYQTQTAMRVLEKIAKKYESEVSFKCGFVDEALDQLYQREQLTAKIILYFSVLAIFIACLGLFGLAAFTAEQRTKEIGIRKVLGATVASITALLSREFLLLVGIALLIASPIAYYLMSWWLQDFAYRIRIEWWMFGLAGGLSMFIAFATVSYQAIKAALMNPVKSLKTE